MCQQQLVKLRKQCDNTVKTFLDLELKFIVKEREKHEYSQEYNEILQNTKLTPTPSEKGAEDTLAEPLQEDADEDLTPVDESKVSVEKGSPPPEPVPTQERSALGLERNKAITAHQQLLCCPGKRVLWFRTTHESGWVTMLCVGLLSKSLQAESGKS